MTLKHKTHQSPTSIRTDSRRAWFMWSVVGLAYVFVFFQRVAPQTIVDRLMADFNVGAAHIGMVTSAYFYGYMLMQFPAGVIVDRWGVRRAVIMSLTASSVGSLWFAHASDVSSASSARALIAVGDALIFTALIKLSAQWFPASRFGFMSGLSQVWGYLGGLLATTPLAVMVSYGGWRSSFRLLAYMVVANFILVLVSLRTHPPHLVEQGRRLSTILRDAAWALQRLTTWGQVMTFVGTYLSTVSLSGVWGVPLFMQAYGLSRASASLQMFGFMAGYAAGSVVLGYLVDAYLSSVRKPLLVIGIVRLGLLLAIAPVIGAHLSVWILMGGMVILGFIGGGMQPLLLTSVKQAFTSDRIGTAISINTTVANLVGALIQPLLGAILGYYWAGAWVDGVRLYTATGYTWLLVSLAVLSLGAVVGPLFIVEKGPAHEGLDTSSQHSGSGSIPGDAPPAIFSVENRGTTAR